MTSCSLSVSLLILFALLLLCSDLIDPVDGFFMDKNDSDCIYLDDIILCDFPSAEKQEELWLNQYYG